MKAESSIKVKGMHCNSCATIIKESLSKLKGVEKTEVSLEDDNVKIKFDSEKISKEKIEGELSALGYLPKAFPSSPKKTNSLKQGIIYGLVPHIGCMGFIVGSILGVTIAIEFFKPLLMNPWFFHILILLALVFASVSSMFYLRKNGLLSWKGVKKKKKYLTAMYGSTIGINLFLFFVIFPMTANFDTGSFANTTGNLALGAENINLPGDDSLLTLQVDIPCPGHAPLISGEIKTITGITGVRYRGPALFDVAFDSEKTSKDEILLLEVFEVYPATVTFESKEISLAEDKETKTTENTVKETTSLALENNNDNLTASCDGSCGGTGTCGKPLCGCSAG